MQAIVLAVDDPRWTHPLAPDSPTATLPIGRSAAAEHVLRAVATTDVDRVTLVDPSGAVTDAVAGDVEYERTLELGDALDQGDDGVVVLPASVLLDTPTVAALVRRAPAAAFARRETPSRFVAVDTDGSGVEDPLAFTGAVSLPASCRDANPTVDEDSATGDGTAIDALVANGVDVGLEPVVADHWYDLERPWDLLEANADVLAGLDGRREGRIHPDAELTGTVVVEPNAVVESGVVVEGPAFVGRGATVGPNAYIRGATYLGPHAHAGHAVEVKNSVFLAGATAGHLSYVGDSLLGRDVNFGASTVVANLRHDDESVRARTVEGRLSTGRRKLGVVAGEGVKTAIGTNLNAGVTLGPGARTTPGETVVRDA